MIISAFITVLLFGVDDGQASLPMGSTGLTMTVDVGIGFAAASILRPVPNIS
jgi:hypothetical protein